ncbi:RNA ligase family protein [Zooshikella sp. RANM57]|uniref:RNA ligase family protein n=1 Tax=Zooshikella sp. RANM57 TaxID=3425863 RepID=UPI003D6F6A90
MSVIKYPKTYHIEGSKLFQITAPVELNQSLMKIPLQSVQSQYLVIEEKMDGTQISVSFLPSKQPVFQSRGTILKGGKGEGEFDLLKQWGWQYHTELWELLEDRYILFGEWLYYRHTIFYDVLPAYFLEFDIYDKKNGVFLSTEERKKRLAGCSFIHSVRVIDSGCFKYVGELIALISYSAFISKNYRTNFLKQNVKNATLDKITDTLDRYMEGLYIKVENKAEVVARYKFIRGDFLTRINSVNAHLSKLSVTHNGLISL